MERQVPSLLAPIPSVDNDQVSPRLGIAAAIANDIALRFVTIQNYLVQTNSTWFAQVQNYFSILTTRLSGTYQVSPTFGIDNVFTFEVFKFILSIIGLAFAVVGIRLGVALF